jgi:HSP20 family protein
MANLTRWDPYNDMISLRDAMDQLLENALISFGRTTGGQRSSMAFAFPVDITEQDDHYIVKASLPGIKPEDLDITVQDNLLTIQGEMQAEEEKKEERYHLRERRWGSFARSIALPTGVDANNVQAEYENGILTLTLPKSQEARPKHISVKGGAEKTIEGQSTSFNTPDQSGSQGGSASQG